MGDRQRAEIRFVMMSAELRAEPFIQHEQLVDTGSTAKPGPPAFVTPVRPSDGGNVP